MSCCGTACVNTITWLRFASIRLTCFFNWEHLRTSESSFRIFGLLVLSWLMSHLCLLFLSPFIQDEQSAMLMLKRHTILKQAVDDYTDSIQKLADRAQKMFAEDHPDGSVL